MSNPWQIPAVIQHTQRLLHSFQHWTGRELLVPTTKTPAAQAEALFRAPFVVVSHGTQSDPIFNYGNQQALELWEFDWADFTQLPSRASAAPASQAEREALLQQAREQGYISDYRGIRRSRSGQRFWIENVILWDVLTESGAICGQAATFPHWVRIPPDAG